MPLTIRAATFLTLIALVGCSYEPKTRPEPVEFTGQVTLQSGVTPRGLRITFRPLIDALPGGGPLDDKGGFKVQLTPGDHIVYFDEEANAKVAAYKKLPESFRSPNEANKITAAQGTPIAVTVQ